MKIHNRDVTVEVVRRHLGRRWFLWWDCDNRNHMAAGSSLEDAVSAMEDLFQYLAGYPPSGLPGDCGWIIVDNGKSAPVRRDGGLSFDGLLANTEAFDYLFTSTRGNQP
jgi:hypothetical protein